MSVAIELSDVSKSYHGTPVLHALNLAVNEQSVFAFLGKNGAGKSTTIRIMAGLLAADSGEVSLLGLPLNKAKKTILQQVGFLIDSPSYYPNLTAYEFLSIACRLKNIAKSEIDFILDYVGLGEAKHKVIHQYSLGMKQRVSLANTLLGRPKLIVVDEPTNGLDPHGIKEVRELIKSLPAAFGCTVFLSCHNLEEVQKTATDFAVLHKGSITYQSSIDAWQQSRIKGWKMHVSNTELAMQCCQTIGVTCQRNNHSIELETHEQSIIANLHQQLIAQNIHLYRSEPMTESLESWFLEHT